MRPLLVLLLGVIHMATPLNILVYNVKFGRSHSNYIGRIADLLVDAGHNVTSLIPEMNPSVFDGTTKSKIIRVPQDPRAGEYVKMMFADGAFDPFAMKFSLPLQIMQIFFAHYFGDMFTKKCEALLDDAETLKQLKDAKFDVVISEAVDYCGIGSMLASTPPPPLIGAKSLITVSTTFLLENVARDLGIPHAYSFNPAVSRSSPPRSLLDRLRNAMDESIGSYTMNKAQTMFTELFRSRFGAEYPDMKYLLTRSVFHFTNSEPLLDFARPILPKVIGLGGLGAQAPKRLDEEWEGILKERKTNVLMSFGSVAQSAKMPMDSKRAVLEVFSRISDVTFIWKYEEIDDAFATGEAALVLNVKLVKWTPQNDLLADPRLTMFISHGGAGSTFECAIHGKPAILIPLFADQPRNAGMLAHAGLGVVFDKFDLVDEAKFEGAIREVLGNAAYTEAARKTSALLAKRPYAPEEVLVKHVEFAGVSGPIETMIPGSIGQPIVEYYMLDVIVIIIIGVISCLSVFFFMISKAIAKYRALKPKND